MKRLTIAAIVIESVGIALLALALIEGVNTNPAGYLALLGGFLVTCGAFLFSKIRKGG